MLVINPNLFYNLKVCSLETTCLRQRRIHPSKHFWKRMLPSGNLSFEKKKKCCWSQSYLAKKLVARWYLLIVFWSQIRSQWWICVEAHYCPLKCRIAEILLFISFLIFILFILFIYLMDVNSSSMKITKLLYIYTRLNTFKYISKQSLKMSKYLSSSLPIFQKFFVLIFSLHYIWTCFLCKF